MTSEQHAIAFANVRQRLVEHGFPFATRCKTLEAIGESLSCYVPRLVRQLTLQDLLNAPQSELSQCYDFDSWAIRDIILLMERLLDEAGGRQCSEPTGGINDSQMETTVLDVSLGLSPDSARSHQHVADVPLDAQTTLEMQELRDGLRWHFEASCDVINADATHPSVNKELREFLEPGDTHFPLGYLNWTVREILATTFDFWLGRWTDLEPVCCMATLLSRAASMVESATGYPAEHAISPDTPLRTQSDAMPRELDVDGNSWVHWCAAIHNAGLERVKLGTVAVSLRTLPTGLWDQPLANFTTSSLAQLAGVPGLGPARMKHVVEAVRELAAF